MNPYQIELPENVSASQLMEIAFQKSVHHAVSHRHEQFNSKDEKAELTVKYSRSYESIKEDYANWTVKQHQQKHLLHRKFAIALPAALITIAAFFGVAFNKGNVAIKSQQNMAHSQQALASNK